MRSHASGAGSEYSHDVTAAILLIQTNPVGDGLFSYVKNFKSAKSPRACLKMVAAFKSSINRITVAHIGQFSS